MKRLIGSVSIFAAIVTLLIVAIFNNQTVKQTNVALAANGTTVVAPTTGNLLLNPSFESGVANWNKGNWGSNTATFTYAATGHTGSHSATVSMTKYKNGDAKWYPTPVNAQSSTVYTFSDWYQSSVPSEVDAVITTTTGQTSYMWLASDAASTTWKQNKVTFNTPANTSKITFYHTISKNGTLTTDDYDFELAAPATPVTPVIPTPTPTPTPPVIVTPPVIPTPTPTPTPPVISISSPVSGATVKGTQTITSNITDAQGIASVQYSLDGQPLGSPVTSSPFSLSWDTTKVTNGDHVLSAAVKDTANLSSLSVAIVVTVNNQVVPTAPTAQITSPTANTTVSATQTITSNITDAQGIASVQYSLDGQPLGSPVTTAPYSYSWDTTKVANGVHSLTVTAKNTANLSTTSTAVSVTVSNTVVTPPVTPVSTNTIPNPSVETVDPTTTSEPDNWNADTYGSNTAAFSYLTTGHTGSRSVSVKVSNYVDGSADWSYTAQTATPGHYRFTDWYMSDASTEIDAAVTVNGVVQYYYLGSVLPSTTWAQASAEFDMPAGATSITIFHLLAANGTLTTDDFNFGLYTPAPFNRGIVSLTFDDGWQNQYTNAAPLLKANGQVATFYIISGELQDQPDYMSTAQIKNLIVAGNELGSHSITHPDLTTLTTAQMQNEMKQSQTTLQSTFGVQVTNFAYPYGAYNAATIAYGKTLYVSQRTVQSGYNTKDNLDLTKVLVQNVFNTTTPAQVADWVNTANAQHTWLVLVYHEVAVTPSDPTDVDYDTQPSDLAAELAQIKASGIAVETMQQAIAEVSAQH